MYIHVFYMYAYPLLLHSFDMGNARVFNNLQLLLITHLMCVNYQEQQLPKPLLALKPIVIYIICMFTTVCVGWDMFSFP